MGQAIKKRVDVEGEANVEEQVNTERWREGGRICQHAILSENMGLSGCGVKNRVTAEKNANLSFHRTLDRTSIQA